MAESATTHENTANIAAPVVKTGGEHTSSFDELEVQFEATKEGAKARKVEQKEYKESKDAEPKEPKKAETKDEPEAKEVKTSEDAKEPVQAKETTKVKPYKVQIAGKSLDLPADTPLEIKVDGKKEKVTVEDLVRNYNGKVSWEKKHGEYGQQKGKLESEVKKFQNESQQLQLAINNLYELAVTQKKPKEAILYLAEALGGDPVTTWKALKGQVLEAYKDSTNLTEDQLREIDEREELEYHRTKNQADKAKAAEAEAKKSLETRVQKQLDRTGIPMPEFVKAYDELKSAGVKDLNPEVVGDYVAQLKLHTGVKEIVASLGITDPAKADKVRKDLLDVVNKFPGTSMEQLKEIAAEVWTPTAKPDGVAAKIQKREAGGAKPRSHEPQREALNFDDL